MREVQFSCEVKTRWWLIKRKTEAGSCYWLARLLIGVPSVAGGWSIGFFRRMPACLHYGPVTVSPAPPRPRAFDVIASERERADHLLMPPLESGRCVCLRGGGGGGRAVCWEESSVRRNLSLSAFRFCYCVSCLSGGSLLITDAVINIHIIHFDSSQTFTSGNITSNRSVLDNLISEAFCCLLWHDWAVYVALKTFWENSYFFASDFGLAVCKNTQMKQFSSHFLQIRTG